MLRRIVVPLLTLLGFAAIDSACADPAAVASLRRDLQSAVNHGDLKQLRSVRARFSALAQADPKDARLHYWIAVTSWRAIPIAILKDRKLAGEMGEDALAHADQALALDSKFAEALAVKAGLQGILISLQPDAMMTLGPQSGANLARAATLQPDNPRIHLLVGISTLHKPANFGGGAKPALEELERSQSLFAKESVADSTAPNWGRDDAFLWAGRAQMEMRDFEAARRSFQSALDANPGNGWVKSSLLPAAVDSVTAHPKP
jgi:tetratricopeptide (TPR) repeat protein